MEEVRPVSYEDRAGETAQDIIRSRDPSFFPAPSPPVSGRGTKKQEEPEVGGSRPKEETNLNIINNHSFPLQEKCQVPDMTPGTSLEDHKELGRVSSM